MLIVDDVASTRRFLRAVLENCIQFHVVGEASDGYVAIEISKTVQPDLVVLDLSMPMVDGAMALAGILQVAPKARVIVVSGMNPANGEPLLKAGASAFVPKGIPPFELLERLGSILNRTLTMERRTGWEEVLSDHRAVVCDKSPPIRHLITRVLDECSSRGSTSTVRTLPLRFPRRQPRRDDHWSVMTLVVLVHQRDPANVARSAIEISR